MVSLLDVLANKTDYQFNYNDDSEWTSSFFLSNLFLCGLV